MMALSPFTKPYSRRTSHVPLDMQYLSTFLGAKVPGLPRMTCPIYFSEARTELMTFYVSVQLAGLNKRGSSTISISTESGWSRIINRRHHLRCCLAVFPVIEPCFWVELVSRVPKVCRWLGGAFRDSRLLFVRVQADFELDVGFTPRLRWRPVCQKPRLRGRPD